MLKLVTNLDETNGKKLVTIVMPARNDEGNLSQAYDEVSGVMATRAYDYEVILVDRGSNAVRAVKGVSFDIGRGDWRDAPAGRKTHS